MYRKILLLIGIIGFNVVLMIWSVNSLAQSRGTPSKDPFEVYQEKSVRINQTYAREYLSLAKWCKTKRLFDQAGENFELVLEYDPENKQARKALDKGFPKDAPKPKDIEQLLGQYDQKLLTLYKKLADKHCALGVWCKQNKLFAEANREFNRAIKLCADHKKTVKAREELAQCKVEGLGWFDKNTAAKLRKGLRKYKGKWLPRDEVEKLRTNWEDAWEIKTRHYLIRTNNTYEQGYEIGQEAENVYQMYFQIMGKILELKKPKGLMSIYYFKSEEDYKTEFQRIHSESPPSPTGIYHCDGAKNIYRVYFWGPQKKYTGEEKDVLRHECTHQLNRLATGGQSGSWLEEGLAVYFEGVRRDKYGRLTVGDIKHPRFGGEIKGCVAGFPIAIKTQEVIGLKRFLQLRVNEIIGFNYDQGAALVRFFLNSKPGQKYKDQFLKYIQMCYTTPRDSQTWFREIDALKAFQECFPNVDLDELEKDFLAGWDK